MARTKKIAITVDGELLAHAERLRRTTNESRSAVFSRALRTLLDEEARAAKVAAYIEGYRRIPETGVDWVDELSLASLAEVPWEESSAQRRQRKAS